MKRRISGAAQRMLSAVLLLSMTGCSSVPRDSEYRVLVDVISNPPGAEFLGPGRTPRRTPAKIPIRDGYSLTIVLKKDGYEPHRVKISPRNRPKNLDPRNPIFYDSPFVFAFVLSREALRFFSGANGVLTMSPNPVNIDLTPSDGSLPDFPTDPRSVDTSDVSCTSPIELTQDCSGWRSAKPARRLHVRGLDVRVAGSATGKELLVVHDNIHPISLGLYPDGYGPDACMRVMREALAYGPRLLHLTAVESDRVTHGCYLEFDGDVYAQLKSLTIEE